MSKLYISTCFLAMLKTDQLCLLVRYYGKNVMHPPDLIKSLRISQKNREPNSCETSRNLRIGVDRIKQNSNDVSSSVQTKKIKTQDDRFRTLIDSIRNRTTRETLGLTYICGTALIRDAIGKGVLLPEIYFHNSIHLQALPQQSLIDTGVQFVPVSKELFTKHLSPELSITDGLLGCVDVWDPKVLQMGHGAHFDASIQTNLDWNEIGEILPTNSRIYLADSSHVEGRETNDRQEANDPPPHHRLICEYDCIDYCNGHAVIVIGGETKGINWSAFDYSRTTRDRPQHRIHVPMMSGIDSLNSAVAGSIILFEIGRQMKLRSHK